MCAKRQMAGRFCPKLGASESNTEEENVMSQNRKSMTAVVALSALLAGLYGCEKKEGPMEKAGKEVDKAAVSAGQQVEKAGEKIKDAAQGDNK